LRCLLPSLHLRRAADVVVLVLVLVLAVEVVAAVGLLPARRPVGRRQLEHLPHPHLSQRQVERLREAVVEGLVRVPEVGLEAGVEVEDEVVGPRSLRHLFL
jgi:hypothetical protein